MRSIFILFFVVLSMSIQAQSQDEKLAYQYFSSKEFEKAVVLYEDVYKDNPSNDVYQPYLASLLFLEQYKSAEKLVKKHLKRNENQISLYIDLGTVYEAWGKESKANKSYDEAISELQPEVHSILSVGNSFYIKKQYAYAIKTYERGAKLLDNEYPFAFELAKIYEAQGNLGKMTTSLLGVLDFGQEYLESVQNALSTILSSDPDGSRSNAIQKELIKKVQSNPDHVVFTELLIWFYLQNKNYSSALIHAKALDRRNDENGRRVLQLANVCVQNKEFKTAIAAYQYILSKGNDSYYYRRARVELVGVLNERLNNDPNAGLAEVEILKSSYSDALNDLGVNAFTIDLVRGYSHLLAFHLNKTEEAKELLNEAIAMPRAKLTDVAKCKIELGDIYVMEDEVWEAALLYGQVNQDFKEDEIGHEAKLKTAKAYFYTGDFDWAKAQLDVLKASTTKLIANDAMQLSILISDNLNMDTSAVPLKMYATADLLFYQNKDSLALLKLDSILDLFPKHLTLLDDVYFKKASIYKGNKEWDLAIQNFQKAVDYKDLLKDDALFEMAKIYEDVLDLPVEALKCYELIILEHDDSIYSVEARKQFRRLRGDKI